MDILADILNKKIICTCGRQHAVPIQYINLKCDMKNIFQTCLEYFQEKKVLVVSDIHTHAIYGEQIVCALEENGLSLDSFIFEDEELLPNEEAVGTLMMHVKMGIGGMIAVGSGTINDLVRLAASRLHVPFLSVPTAPSMDGYASSVSSLILKNKKSTFPGIPAVAILGDINVIRQAPLEMIQAGFGDIIGKKISLSDWMLSSMMNDEYLCQYAMKLVENATNICLQNVDKIYNRDTEGMVYLMEALILSGLAISIVGDSRPASGAEHLLAHYFEMKSLKEGKKSIHHGTAVAIGTYLGSMMYDYILHSKEFQRIKNHKEIEKELMCFTPSTREVRQWLESIGLSENPMDYGIDQDLVKEALLKARFTRNRYTVLTFAAEMNVLEKAAEHVVEKIY